MTSGEEAFIVLAEEMNFTRAASRMYISQQALSKHIQKLEEKYGTMLFQRKPKVRLTETGEALLEMLRRQSAMERDVANRISELEQGETGTITLGISASGLRTFGIGVFEKYHRMHPGVQLDIAAAVSRVLEEDLLHGRMDCVIAVDPEAHEEIRVEPLFQDALYLLVPEEIAAERSGSRTTADIETYADLPFVQNRQRSRTTGHINAFLDRKGINLRNIMTVSAYDVQLELCRNLHTAMFTSGSFVAFGETTILKDDMRALRVRGLDEKVTVCLLTDRNRIYTKCAEDFFAVVRETLSGMKLRLSV